ncbi:MAG: TIGR00269 family protein [Candidatus Nitrosocaldus sp.]|nr:TIGR00269 family protein [Candidatus Nitrosocaldus sp.]
MGMSTRPCTYCNAESVYHRRYSGEYLCSRCFTRSVQRKVARTVSRYSMIRYGDRVAVAVSGGKDSLSLLHILSRASRRHGNELVAVTIDEGIAGYRDESLSIAREFTSMLGIEHITLSYRELFGSTLEGFLKMRGENGINMSSCAICGTFRRRAIDIAAKVAGADVIATAHNLDDMLQTFLINISAGDVERIAWMYPEPVEYADGLRKVKPLLEVYEHEIAFYALTNDIPFQSEQCPYMNEGIRGYMREFLNGLEQRHPGIKYNMLNTILKVSKTLRDNLEFKRYRCSVCSRECSSAGVCSSCMLAMRLVGDAGRGI